MTSPTPEDDRFPPTGTPADPAAPVEPDRKTRRFLPILLGVLAGAALVYGIVWVFWNERFPQGPTDQRGRVEANADAFQDRGAGATNPDAPTTATGEPAAPSPDDDPNVNSPATGMDASRQ